MSRHDDAALRVGLIGCGFIGHRHLGVLAALEDARIVAVVDELPERAALAAAAADARAYADYAEMLA